MVSVMILAMETILGLVCVDNPFFSWYRWCWFLS